MSAFLYFAGSDGTGTEVQGRPGVACGTCWALTGTQRSAAGRSIVVYVNNECGRGEGTTGKDCNCCQSSFIDLNSANAQAVFDECTDSGASIGLLGSDMAEGGGTAEQVSCDQWCGVLADGTKKGPEGCNPGGESANITVI